MATTRYQPFKIKYNKPQAICTMTYATEELAKEYAISRGLKEWEIYIKECYYEGNEWNTNIDFKKNKDDNE